jgi:predicted MFS family arabinose efflux permease
MQNPDAFYTILSLYGLAIFCGIMLFGWFIDKLSGL